MAVQCFVSQHGKGVSLARFEECKAACGYEHKAYSPIHTCYGSRMIISPIPQQDI